MLEKIVSYIYEKLFSDETKFNHMNVSESLKLLYPASNQNELVKEYYMDKIKYSIYIIVLITILAFVSLVSGYINSAIKDNLFIKRNNYSEGDLKKELEVDAGKIYQGKYEIDLSEREYSYDEIMEIFKSETDEIEKKFLGRNLSVDCVNKPLNFIKSIYNDQINIDWIVDNNEIIDSQGNLKEEAISDEGDLIEVTAILKYRDIKFNHIFSIMVCKPEYTVTEQFLRELKESVKQNNEESLTDEYVELPNEVNGTKIKWKVPQENTAFVIMLLGIIVIVALFIAKDNELEKKIQERNRQMLVDYPEIVSKLTLMLSAGMTVFMVWNRIVEEYSEMIKKNGKKRFAYEEMSITLHEIQDGIPELQAYDRFGKRCRVQKYLRFSSLITQNVRMGSKGLAGMLQSEVRGALEDRKNMARKSGEEAGTKLLAPMMMMLLIVLIIIMAPAFLSFNFNS